MGNVEFETLYIFFPPSLNGMRAKKGKEGEEVIKNEK